MGKLLVIVDYCVCGRGDSYREISIVEKSLIDILNEVFNRDAYEDEAKVSDEEFFYMCTEMNGEENYLEVYSIDGDNLTPIFCFDTTEVKS